MLNKIVIVLALSLFGINYAYSEETLTITTYYPSPYGIYNKLSTSRLSVGYFSDSEQPRSDGNIRLRQHSSAPPVESGILGETAYASDGNLYVHNGSTWVKQGSSGASYTYYCFTNNGASTMGSPVCGSSWTVGTQGPCDAGYTLQKLLGGWGVCYQGTTQIFMPPGGGCNMSAGWAGSTLGGAGVCTRN